MHEFSNKKILFNQIKEHVVSNEILDKETVINLIKQYPKFRYRGPAYRGIYSFEAESELTWNHNESNICWSHVPESIVSVMRSQLISEDVSKIQIYKANIVGFDLSRFIKENEDDFRSLNFPDEQEILCVRYDSVRLFKQIA